ncbi:MAG: hypothetical protein ACRD07_06510 [Acidimicrobiales bacterium]
MPSELLVTAKRRPAAASRQHTADVEAHRIERRRCRPVVVHPVTLPLAGGIYESDATLSM